MLARREFEAMNEETSKNAVQLEAGDELFNIVDRDFSAKSGGTRGR